MDILLKIWPSISAIAQAIERPYPTVASWKRRGIPPKEYPVLIEAARRDGFVLTYEQLVAEPIEGAA